MKALFYINGSFDGETKRSELTFEELGVTEKDNEETLRDKLESYFIYHFLKDDIKTYYHEDNKSQGYFFGIEGFKTTDHANYEDLGINENTSEDEKIEILESMLEEFLGNYDSGWLIIKK